MSFQWKFIKGNPLIPIHTLMAEMPTVCGLSELLEKFRRISLYVTENSIAKPYVT